MAVIIGRHDRVDIPILAANETAAGGSVQFAERRRSSVVEQPPCKRQVVCSIQTGGTNYFKHLHDSRCPLPGFIQRLSNVPRAAKSYREAASGSKTLEKAGTVATRDSCSGVTRYVSHRSSAG